jgi:hypothetical protein
MTSARATLCALLIQTTCDECILHQFQCGIDAYVRFILHLLSH